ncbi:hypothetical protein EV179_003533 [Coemansia sp. RSA 487]|nr:hypothetical protein EV179_003533 [Coemansia sp. RSA 487]
MKAGYVAASCIDLRYNKVDTSTNYKIYFTPMLNSDSFAVDLDPSDITIHPNYDPVSYANNIAVVQYNKDTTDNYFTYMEADPYIGNIDVYTRWAFNQSLNDWTMPELSNESSDDSGCAAGSSLYAYNQQWLKCTSATTTSVQAEDCTMPYSILFKENRTSTIIMSHLYSHSVVYGSSMCDGPVKVLSYYTSMKLYAGWTVKVLGRPIRLFVGTGFIFWTDTDVGQMDPRATVDNPSGTLVVSGDLYQVQQKMVGGGDFASTSASKTSESSNTTSSDISDSTDESKGSSDQETTDDNPTDSTIQSRDKNGSGKDNDGSHNNDNTTQGSGGLTKEAKIAVGVAVPVAVIIIGIACVVGLKVWRSRSKTDNWDPQGEESQLRSAALELCLENPQPVPPPPPPPPPPPRYSRAATRGGGDYQPESLFEVKKI